MWGVGNRKRPDGVDDESGRALFRELGAKGGQVPARSSRRRPLLLGIGAALVIGVASVFAVATARADTPSGSGHEIDGVIADSNSTNFPDPVGSVKELGPVNGAPTKVGVINTAPTPMLGFTAINGGDDLSGMWLDTTVAPNGHIWLYIAWKRDSATTSQVAFEFDKNAQPAACNYAGVNQSEHSPLSAAETAFINTCNPWQNRSTGDFIIDWDLQGNSTTLDFRVFTLGSGFGQKIPLSDPAVVKASFGTGGNAKEGEAAIDLTAAGIFPEQPTTCLTFANVIAATVTGNSDEADFKDTILADTSGVGITNCGSIKVIKNTGGPNGTFGFTTTSVPVTAYDPFDITTSGGTGSHQQDNLLAGTYTVTESGPPANWSFTSLTCDNGQGSTIAGQTATIRLQAEQMVTCTYTNARAPQLTVIKQIVNNNGQTFDVKVAGTTVLEDVGGTGSQVTNTYTAPFAYTVTETFGTGGAVSSDWTVTTTGDCSGTLQNGDDKTCTVVNTLKPLPQLRVVKSCPSGAAREGDVFQPKNGEASVGAALACGAESTTSLTPDVAFSISEAAAGTTVLADYTQSKTGTCSGTPKRGDALVTCTLVNTLKPKPTIGVTKTANPTQVQDSGLVTFTAVVTNTSRYPLTIDTLTDSIYGNLITGSTKATCKFGANVVSLPYTLPAGESLVCTFQATVTQTETDVVTSSGIDERQNRVTATANATVTVTRTPPPPPPAPKTDVAIQKDATTQVTLGSDGKATIVYDIRVSDNGPDPAGGVTVSDAAPSGVTFTQIAQQPSQGSCSIQSGGALLSCSLGTLVAGQSVAIKVNATVTVTGTITNTGTTTTTTPDTNPANNTDSAQTLVVAPVKPPVTPKPPVVLPEICNTIEVTPKMLKGNGKAQKIGVKVTLGKSNKGVAGVTIKITGLGISKTVTSGKNGKATVTVTPKQPGIIKVEIQNKKACNTQRIGVVGVYEPPVTG